MARPAGQIVQRGPRLWLVRIFLGATFGGGERYVERLRKIEDLERKTYA